MPDATSFSPNWFSRLLGTRRNAMLSSSSYASSAA